MQHDFHQALRTIREANTEFKNGKLDRADYLARRNPALISALHAIAQHLGVELRPIRRISVTGEVYLEAVEGRGPGQVCGKFGEPFVALLNKVAPRAGAIHGARLNRYAGQCYLHHEAAEALVLTHAPALLA